MPLIHIRDQRRIKDNFFICRGDLRSPDFYLVGAYLWSPAFLISNIITISRDTINRGKRPSMRGKAPFISQVLFSQFIASIVTLFF